MMKRYIMVALLAVSSGIAVGAAKSADFLSLVNQARVGLAQAKKAVAAGSVDAYANAKQSVADAIASLRARFVGVKGQADMSQTVKRFAKELAELEASVEQGEEEGVEAEHSSEGE